MFSYIQSLFHSGNISSQSHGHFTAGSALTTASVASTGLFWGLHMADIYMAVSCIAAICGVIIQVCVAIHTMRKK